MIKCKLLDFETQYRAVCEDSAVSYGSGTVTETPRDSYCDTRKCALQGLGTVAAVVADGTANDLNTNNMSLNAILNHMEQTESDAYAKDKAVPLNDKEREYAERIFFEKQLKECNPGMSDVKVKGRIEKSVAIARMLYKEIYGN